MTPQQTGTQGSGIIGSIVHTNTRVRRKKTVRRTRFGMMDFGQGLVYIDDNPPAPHSGKS